VHRGYIKLWRKIFDSGIQKEHTTFTMWIWILCNVTRKPLNYIARSQKIILNPGELIIGRKKLAMELRLSEQCVRTCLHHLESWGNITINSTNRFSILKVVNWESYQETQIEINQQINQELTSNQPATNQQLTTKQEVKKLRSKNKDNVVLSGFDEFWKAYPKKIGKQEAKKAWGRQNGNRPDIELIVSKIAELKKSSQWSKDNGQFIPHPATWLNRGGWDDEIKIEIKEQLFDLNKEKNSLDEILKKAQERERYLKGEL
jgi:hypothetical protein